MSITREEASDLTSAAHKLAAANTIVEKTAAFYRLKRIIANLRGDAAMLVHSQEAIEQLGGSNE